jgi:recombination protein RecT
MGVNNSLVKDDRKPKFSVAIQSEGYKKMINNVLGDPKIAQRFVTTISSAVALNPVLQECDTMSIVSAALQGEALGLSPSASLGQYYLVPYNDKNKGCKVAQFQLGAKGYKQLAMRSGQYKDIDVIEIRRGEYKGRDKNTGRHIIEFIEDDEVREAAEVVGYAAWFELLNGFFKRVYWSKEKMEKHADTYSQAFSIEMYRKIERGEIPKSDMWKYSSFWYKNFDQMAQKTMIRHLISQWGIMSIEMQQAIEKDMAIFDDKGNAMFVENDDFIEGNAVVESVTDVDEPKQEASATKSATGRSRNRKENTAPAEAEPEEAEREITDNSPEEPEYAAMDDDDPLAF